MTLKFLSKIYLISFALIFLLGTVFAFNFIKITSIDSEYDLKRFMVLGTVWVFSLAFCFVKDLQLPRFSSLTLKCLAAFLVLATISTAFSKHPFWGVVELTNFLILFIALCMFLVSISQIYKANFFSWVYAFFLLFSILTFIKYALFLSFSYSDSQSFNIHGLLSGYVNVRFFNQIQVMVFGILFIPYFSKNLKRMKIVSLLVLAMHWMVLLQTEARGAILSILLSMTVICIFLNANVRKLLISILLKSMFLGGVMWLIFIISIPYFLMDAMSFQMRTTSSGRLDLWLYVLKHIPENPFFGYGPMSFSWAEGKSSHVAHPHNSVIQFLYEYGGISFSLIALYSVKKLLPQFRNLLSNSNSNSLDLVVLYTFLSGGCYSLFSGVVVMPFAQILLVFFVAVVAGGKTVAISKYEKVALRVLLPVITSICLMVIVWSYKHMDLKGALFPRVWVNGLLGY